MLPAKSQLKEQSSDDEDSDFDGNDRDNLNYTVKKIDKVVGKYGNIFGGYAASLDLGDDGTFDFGKNVNIAQGTVTNQIVATPPLKKTVSKIIERKTKTEAEIIRDDELEDALDGDETENDIKNLKAIMQGISLLD